VGASGLAASGALTGASPADADQILDPVAGTVLAWLSAPGAGEAGPVWRDPAGAVSSLTLDPGMAYWFRHRGDAAVSWQMARPYPADLFAESVDTPAIAEITAGASGSGPSVVIRGPAGANCRVTVMGQDVAAGGGFDPAGAWRVLAAGIEVPADGRATWPDAGGPGAAEFADLLRVYAVCREDMDSDGDGLSDGYERLVSRTDARKADTDGDGLPDGWELAKGVDPLTADGGADPDGDGLTTAEEYALGTNPTAPPLPPSVHLQVDSSCRVTAGTAVAVTAWYRSGSDVALIRRVHEQSPDIEPPQQALLDGIDLIAGGKTVQTWTNTSGGRQGAVDFVLDVSGWEEGTHVVVAVGRWHAVTASAGPDAGRSRPASFRLDRTPPAAPAVTSVSVVDGTVMPDGSVRIEGHDATLVMPVDREARWAAFTVTPEDAFRVAYNDWEIADGVLTVRLRGVRMGLAIVTIELLDEARNASHGQLVLERVAPSAKGGDAQ
jgi:hypothetical protein